MTVFVTITSGDSVAAQNPNQARVPERVNSSPLESDTDIKLKPDKLINEYRTIDGSNNNLTNLTWGRADTPFIRLAASDYGDEKNTLAGNSRPSPRRISNRVNSASATAPRGAPVSDMFWQWGQFLDHDLTLTPEIEPVQSANIIVPTGDTWFDPSAEGDQEIDFARSSFSIDARGVRQQHNFITAYIDASNVYGSNTVRENQLRKNDGTGRLKVSAGNLLPFNTSSLPNAPSTASTFFLAGDFRANEQVGLTALHTVFVREHNRIAQELRQRQPNLNGEQVYQRTRAQIGALIQVITYREFLPILLGEAAIPEYQGYKPSVNASISNEFATAAFRVGHTMLSSRILRLDERQREASESHLRLRDAFFQPQQIVQHDIASVLRGLCRQRAQKVDIELVDDVRNLLFGRPGNGGLDLASLNIQRGRDHGLSSYLKTRISLGLPSLSRFDQLNAKPEHISKLRSAYGDINNVDLWVGGLIENPKAGAMVGETFYQILRDQFLRLRDGDRFWYKNHLSPDEIEWVEAQTLSAIIQRNSNVGSEMRAKAMTVPNNAPMGAIYLLFENEDEL